MDTTLGDVISAAEIHTATIGSPGYMRESLRKAARSIDRLNAELQTERKRCNELMRIVGDDRNLTATEVLRQREYAAKHYARRAAKPPLGAPTAPDLLTRAKEHMEARATTYDRPGGERSMGAAVAAFNRIAGHKLTEEQGWLFQEVLKLVRSQQGSYRADNYEDAVAYAALRGECAAKERT